MELEQRIKRNELISKVITEEITRYINDLKYIDLQSFVVELLHTHNMVGILAPEQLDKITNMVDKHNSYGILMSLHLSLHILLGQELVENVAEEIKTVHSKITTPTELDVLRKKTIEDAQGTDGTVTTQVVKTNNVYRTKLVKLHILHCPKNDLDRYELEIPFLDTLLLMKQFVSVHNHIQAT